MRLRPSAAAAAGWGLVLMLPSLVWSQGATCANATFVPPDGRISGGAVTTAGSPVNYFFRVPSTSGNSYSFEVSDTVTGQAASAGSLTVALFSDTACTTALTGRDTKSVDPGVGVFNARASWTATTGNTLVQLTVPANSNLILGWTANDTTLYSTTWSTNGTYDTYYSLKNTTGATISGTLILFNTAGTAVTTTNLVIPARGTGSTNTAVLGTPRGTAGTASFTHDGPPGSILAEADVANFTTTPAYIQPVKFEGVREIR